MGGFAMFLPAVWGLFRPVRGVVPWGWGWARVRVPPNEIVGLPLQAIAPLITDFLLTFSELLSLLAVVVSQTTEKCKLRFNPLPVTSEIHAVWCAAIVRVSGVPVTKIGYNGWHSTTLSNTSKGFSSRWSVSSSSPISTGSIRTVPRVNSRLVSSAALKNCVSTCCCLWAPFFLEKSWKMGGEKGGVYFTFIGIWISMAFFTAVSRPNIVSDA